MDKEKAIYKMVYIVDVLGKKERDYIKDKFQAFCIKKALEEV